MSKKTKKATKKDMTEEELVLYLQAQEEMEQRKQKSVILFLKDKLKEDERSSSLMQRKLHECWRTLLRFDKTEDQWSQIDILKQTWGRQLDGIDSCIREKMEELRDNDRHRAQMYHCHLMHISQRSELQRKHIGKLQQEWESSMTKIKKCYSVKREMSSEDMFQSLNLEDSVPSIKDQYENWLISLMDYNRRIFQENGILVHMTENSKQHAEVLREHQCILRIEELKLKKATVENKGSRDLLEKAKKKENDKKKNKALQSKLLSQEIQMAKVKEQLVWFEKLNQKLVASISCETAMSRNNLVELTVESDKAAGSIKNVIAQGELLLGKLMLCRKMENKMLMTEELQNIVVENQETEDLSAQEEHDVTELSLLRRLHNVAIDKLSALRPQRDALHCQNQQLRYQIQDMLKARHNIEVRGCINCSSLSTASSCGAKPGHVSTKVTTPASSPAEHRTPLSLCSEISVSTAPTVQGTSSFRHKM